MNTSFVASLSLHLTLDKQATVPLFRQLYTGLRVAILDGRLKTGLRLPPTRQIAQDLSISRKTVVNAFEQLIAEGYLEARVGSGTYVVCILPEEVRHASRSAENLPTTQSVQSLHLSTWTATLPARETITLEGKGRAFQPGYPALDEFPSKLWSRLAARAWRTQERSQLAYGNPMGYPPLREVIASYLRASRGVNCASEQVIILTGMWQTLELVSKITVNPGEIVCMEDPGPPGARQSFLDAGTRVIPIAIDQQGLNISTLQQDGVHAQLVYVTPSHQYPLGVTMSLARRLALLEWAKLSGAWILEDDYDSEYRYAGRPLAALQGLDQNGCVLYMGTFSKVLFPGLRLSYLVVPLTLVDLFSRARATTARSAPGADQRILTAFIEEGHFARHIKRMKGIYQERQAVLIEAVQQRLAGTLAISPTSTGLHVMGWLPSGVSDLKAFRFAQTHGIDVSPLSAHTIRPLSKTGLVLGYACVNPQHIRVGVDTLARALEAIRPGT